MSDIHYYIVRKIFPRDLNSYRGWNSSNTVLSDTSSAVPVTLHVDKQQTHATLYN